MHVTGETPQMIWGPWLVHGSLGIANTSLAYIYLIILLFFSFWPATTPTTAATMNYSVLLVGFLVCSSVLYYLFRAKSIYRGPIMEVKRI